MDHSSLSWQLLILSLPTTSATARMRIWRALKAMGCAALRDGAYLLPFAEPQREQLRELADETVREGGNAWLLSVMPQSAGEGEAWRALFDRSAEYAELLLALSATRKKLAGLTPQEINRQLRKLRRDYDAVVATDYFPGEASLHAETAWMDFV